MALLALYQQFLRSPLPDLLADQAALHYITTTTSLHEPAAIAKHLATQAKLLTKKAEKVINSVESGDTLSVEIDTTIEFIAGGGALLPGLDDNFLSDRTVYFPMIHFVVFKDSKISQIRLYWDQATLLKQLDVVGSRGRNWPIRDGKEQVRIATTSAVGDVSRRSTVTEDARSHSSSVTSNSIDRRELHLFEPRQIAEQETPKKHPSGPAPRASAKPVNRDFADILAGVGEDLPRPGSPSDRPPSPRKTSGENVTKGGAGKNYHPIRLFDEVEEVITSPVKTNPKKYKHFEFGNGEGAEPVPKMASRAKHASQWDFSDFSTPNRARPSKVQTHHDARHIKWSDDEQEDKSPVMRPIVHKPRPDSDHHFSIADQSDGEDTQVKQKSFRENVLFKDNVHENNTNTGDQGIQPLTTMVNVDLDSRKQDFGPHFEIADNSPAPARIKPDVDANRARVIKGMGASWSLFDENPDAKKENDYRIKTGGDGMGGRKNVTDHWYD